MSKFVYLIYPVMICLLVWGMKICKKGEWSEDFFSLPQTKFLQGYFAISIMLHHIGQEMCASWQNYTLYPGLEFFVPLGFLFVAFFFFCSGYGLYLSYEKNPTYLENGFLKKKAFPLLIGYYASGLVFFLARWIMGEKMNGWKVFTYLIGFRLANPYAWFALILPLFYVFFYFAFTRCKRHSIGMVIFLVTAYTLLGTWINHNDYLMRGEWWYNCVHLFWIGLLVGKNRERLLNSAKKHYGVKLSLCLIGYICSRYILQPIVSHMFTYYGEGWGIPQVYVMLLRWPCLLAEALSCVLFVMVIVLLSMKIRIGNSFLGFMGTITFEFYLMHGLIVEFFSYRFCDIVKPIVRITNGALMIVVVFVLSIPLALLLKKICHPGKRQ